MQTPIVLSMIESLMAASTLSDLKTKQEEEEVKHSRAQTSFLKVFVYYLHLLGAFIFLKGPIPSHFSSNLFPCLRH